MTSMMAKRRRRIKSLFIYYCVSPSRFNRKHFVFILILGVAAYLSGAKFFRLFYSRNNHELLRIANVDIPCHFPDLDPFDPSIQKYTSLDHEYNVLDCEEDQISLFKSDLRRNLIQLQEPQKYGYFDCCWEEFHRQIQDDFKIEITSPCKRIRQKITIIPRNVEFVRVNCCKTVEGNKSQKVVGIFGFTPLKPVKDQPDFEEPKNKRRVNVVILGLDAVSHMNFLRNFNASYQYLMNNLSATEMWGYTKHGDNTFPNMLSAYTGLTEAELEKRDWNSSMVFDDVPFIWKDFSKEGYRTAFAEDAIKVATFIFGKKGFSNSPTDYYHHPLTRYMEDAIGHRADGWAIVQMCYGNRLAFDVLLELMKKLAVTMDKTRRYFHLTWATSLTHDYLNYGRNGDKYLEETMQWFHNEGYLEDTVLIVISDHGVKRGDIRSTLQGLTEERMPFLYVVVPPWFKATYPSAIKNLKTNEHRLTSHFDTYETLLDLLHLENLEESKLSQRQLALDQAAKMPRGISLFLPVPPGRSCKDAGITIHWCVCEARVPVELEGNEIVVEAAKQVLLTINYMLSPHPQCSILVFDAVLQARVYRSGGELNDKQEALLKLGDQRLKQHSVTYNLLVSVNPSRGTFEATVTHLVDGRWDVSQEISRTNLYGNQSHCIQDYHLKLYCFCVG